MLLRKQPLSNRAVDLPDGRNKKETQLPQSASELYRLRDHRLPAKLAPTFTDRGVPRGQRDRFLQPYSRISRPVMITIPHHY
jgi:hypothetical protein